MFEDCILPHDDAMKQYCPSLCKFCNDFWIAPCNLSTTTGGNCVLASKFEYVVDPAKQKTIEEMRDVITSKLPAGRFLMGLSASDGFVFMAIGINGCPVEFFKSRMPTFESDVDYIKIVPVDWEHYQISLILSGKTTYDYIKANESDLISGFPATSKVQSVTYGGKEGAWIVLFDIYDQAFEQVLDGLGEDLQNA